MFDVSTYTTAAVVFPRILGFVFFWAFGAFIFQIRGLIGQNGILPISSFLFSVGRYYGRNKYFLVPTLFWLNCSDKMLMGVVFLGTFLSILLMLGIFPALLLILLYILYLSIITAGQDFLSFGWEGFLLEVSVHAFFISLSAIPNSVIWFSVYLLLIRFHFFAGFVKLQSGDRNWRNLMALTFHYQTQPIANTQAWFFHKLPVWFHQLSCAFMFFVEMVAPFGVFLTDEVRMWVWIGFVSLQLLIWFTGNFSFLNYLTVALCMVLLNNHYYDLFFGIKPSGSLPETSTWLDAFLSICGGVLCLLQLMRSWQQIKPNPFLYGILRELAPYHLANRYGIFAVMTTKRYEIVIEGSLDGIDWKEYSFKHKASEVSRRPKRISPYQPRIDWQAWFLPFSDYDSEPWFRSFLGHLLKGTPEVLALIKGNPFQDAPPNYVRALIYDYTFSSWDEKKATGNWWHRELVGSYTPSLSLR